MTITKNQVKEIQSALVAKGYDIGKAGVDGDYGKNTRTALLAAISATPAVAKTQVAEAWQSAAMSDKFDAASIAALAQAHPLLQKVMNAARVKIDFIILDSRRGRAAQELAFKKGNSKAHFGDSAHNYTPAIALDIAPGTNRAKIPWDDTKAFIALSKVILPIAKDMGITLRWGGDWNMDGSTADGWDFPHYELHKWRDYAKSAKLFGE